MVSKWQKGFAALCLIIFSLSACGGEQPEENQSENQNQNQNQGLCDPAVDLDCECDPMIHGECDEENQDEQPTGCTEDSQCFGATPYCYTETNTCVSESFICTLLNCAGQRGVCDAPSRSCVDAEVCSSAADCLEGNLCIANSCQSEAEVCSVCGPNQICNYDRNDLSVSCENPVCEPSSRACDGDTLLACNNAGTALNEIFCIDGCDEEAGVCNLPQGDSCKTPLIANPDESFEIDWSYYSNQQEPAFDTGCLANSSQAALARGPDVTFAFEIPAGEVGLARMRTSKEYGLLYLMEDCQEESISCESPEGTSAVTEEGEFVRTLWIYNDESEARTVLITADSSDDANNSPATIEFELHSRICEPHSRQCADSALSQCNTLGTDWEHQLSCSLGCHPDGQGRCATEVYTFCQDAHDTNGQDTFTFEGDMANLAATPEPFDSEDRCEIAPKRGSQSTFHGPVAYFRRSLNQGEQMTLSLSSTFDAAIWIATDCLDEGGQCKEAVNTNMTGISEAEELVYIAPEDEELIIAVQAVEAIDGAAGQYTLDLLVERPQCQGLENGVVLGCVDATHLAYCTGGDYPSLHPCQGGCEDDACAEPQGDRCFDAIDASGGQTYQGSFSKQIHSLKAPAACFGETNITQGGSDTIYRVQVPNQHLLKALVNSPSTHVGLYLISECPNTGSLSDNACLTTSYPSKSLDHHFVQGGTYYLVVTSKNTQERTDFTLELDILPASCEPGNTVCADGVTRVCDDNGYTWTETETCAAACEEADQTGISRRCGALEKPNDQCDKSLLITGPSVIRGSFKDHKDRMNIHEDDCNEAKLSLRGPEAYYLVQMAPKTGLRATVKTAADAYFMSLEECGNTSSCGIQKVGSDGEAFEYYSSQGGTQHLVLKAEKANESQDFEIHFDYFDGECTPEIDRCGVDANNNDVAITCSAVGQETTTICDHGCFEGKCLGQMGDLCERPFDIDNAPETQHDSETLSYQYSGTMAGYGSYYDAYDPGTQKSCTDWQTPGREVVFAFKGWRNDVVNIELNSSFDGNIWVTTDCEQAAASCVAGVDDNFGPGTESLTFEVKETKTYFIMVDSFLAGNSGSFDLDVTIEKGERLEEAKIELQGMDDLVFDLEVGETGSAQFTISNDGGWDLPFELTHTTDWLDFEPSSGAIGGGESQTIDVSFECEAEGERFGNFELNYEAPNHQMIPFVLKVNCTNP